MNRYNRPDFTTSSIEAPDVGSILTDFADRQQRQYQTGLSNAMEQAKVAEEKKRYDEDRAWKLEDRKAAKEERDRILSKETATNEALKAVLDPKAYQKEKMAGEQAAIQSSLANLSPEDKAIAEQQLKVNYKPEVSREQWLTTALSGDNVDQSKVLTTKNALLNMRLNDPTSDEYKANYKAELDKAKELNKITVGGQMSVLGAQRKWAEDKEQKELDKQAKESKKVLDIFTNVPLTSGGVNKTALSDIETRHKDLVSELNNASSKEDKQKVATEIYKLSVEKANILNTKPTARGTEEVRQDILKTLDANNVPITPTILSAVSTRLKDLKVDTDAVENSKKVASYRQALENANVDKNKYKDITSSDVLKDVYDTEVSNKKSGSTYGIGPVTLGMMGTLGIDSEDVVRIKTAADKVKIKDSDLADLLEKRNNQDWTMRHSSNVADDLISDMFWYKNRNNPTQ